MLAPMERGRAFHLQGVLEVQTLVAALEVVVKTFIIVMLAAQAMAVLAL